MYYTANTLKDYSYQICIYDGDHCTTINFTERQLSAWSMLKVALGVVMERRS